MLEFASKCVGSPLLSVALGCALFMSYQICRLSYRYLVQVRDYK